MSDIRHEAPQELVEMFRRREREAGAPLPLSVATRRRIHRRQGLAAAAVATACVLVFVAVSRGSILSADHRPASTPSPQPAPLDLDVTANGRTGLFRWRVLTAQIHDGTVRTVLQTASLAGGDWHAVEERELALGAEPAFGAYRLAGPFPDQGSSSLLWGLVPEGATSIEIRTGEGCPVVRIDASEASTPSADPAVSVWGAEVRCDGPGTITSIGPRGSEVATRVYQPPVASDLWSIATARAGGVGWDLHRLVDLPTGVAVGDAGVPNDIQGSIRGDRLDVDPVAWASTAPGPGGAFVYGIASMNVDRIVFVLGDGSTVKAMRTLLPGDPFQVFWADLSSSAGAELVAFDAGCSVVFQDALSGGHTGDVPPSACRGGRA
jgi:hypothetical protein